MDARRHGCCTRVMGAVSMVLAIGPALRAGEIRIWPTAVVSGESIRLEDIAEARGFDAPTLERLRGLAVSAAPREGGEIQVQVNDVRGALAEAGVNLVDMTLVGSARCAVARPRPPKEMMKASRPAPRIAPTGWQRPATKPNNLTVPAASETAGPTLESAVREFLVARVGDPDGRVEIRFSPTCRRELGLDGAQTKFDIRARDGCKLGLVSLEVCVFSPGQSPRTIPMVVEVSVLKEVVVAKRTLNRGEAIEGRYLKLEGRRFTDYSQVGVTDLAAVTGQQARQMIRPGEMLMARSVEAKALVRRGDPVTIWMRQGGLVIKASGRAQAAGTLGEKIDVARDGTKRKQDLIEAVVTGPATVTIQETRDWKLETRGGVDVERTSSAAVASAAASSARQVRTGE